MCPQFLASQKLNIADSVNRLRRFTLLLAVLRDGGL